ILLWIAVRVVRRNPAISPSAAAWGGLVPIVVVLAWASFQFWPKFLPSRVYPGFPHGLEFVIAPLVFAPIGMVLGLAVATVATRRSAP
ncbi:MAG: hypothetical protein KC591_07505, partial [Gemmatimonadetes bacterium]|nr:hypothetical protein [Gemmatimonadota bacterium]